MKNFNELTIREKEKALIKPVLKNLRQLGGNVSTKQLMQTVVKNTDIIPDDIMTTFKIAKKSGRRYNPFFYNFNYAVSYLVKGNYIERKNHQLFLTSKGMEVDIDHSNFDEDLIANIYSDYGKRAIKRRNNIEITRNNTYVTDHNDSEDDTQQYEEPEWKTNIRKALLDLDPHKFEVFCRKLINNMGIEVDENIGISYTGDGGLDGYGYLKTNDFRTTRVAIQAKRWKENNLVSSPEIDKFRGAMDKFRAEYGIFFTTSDYTKEAIKAARKGSHVITLINGDQLLDLAIKYHVYLHKIYVVDKDFFEG